MSADTQMQNRHVTLSVYSDSLSEGDLVRLIPVVADTTRPGNRGFPTRASWAISEHGSNNREVNDLIDAVVSRIRQAVDAVASTTRKPDSWCQLAVVQYISPAFEGPSFHLTTEVVELLATLGASLDCDQYSSNEDDREDTSPGFVLPHP